MKQILLSPRTGALEVAEVPMPQVRAGMVLVHNVASVLSPGTERHVLDLASNSLIGKARARPDLAREVLNKVRRDGLRTGVRESFLRLETPFPLGYSSAGTVLEVGNGVDDLHAGERVACAGAGWAAHAEVVVVPRRLCVPLPREVSTEAGAFAMLGAIALHGVRRAGVVLGDTVAVLGLGIVGQLTVQLLRGAGCRVVAHDIAAPRVALALSQGADQGAVSADELRGASHLLSRGMGVDAVIVTASTGSSAPLELAAEVARRRGVVVMVGVTGMRVPRRTFWEKELALLLSRASGPGSEEDEYERRGRDYPAPYVRWTAGRNMACFIDELARGTVRTDPLTTHRFPIDRAGDAYDLIRGRSSEPHLGVVLTYPAALSVSRTLTLPAPAVRKAAGMLGIGVIGGGVFARAVLLPALRGVPGVRLQAIATASGVSARDLGARLGFELCTTDYHEVLANPHVDAVVIATRNDLHPVLAAEALRAGKHVFVEKPLALAPEGVRSVLTAYTRTPRVLVVGFNRRYSPLAAAVKAFIGAARPLVLTYRVNAGVVAPDNWVYDPAEGGGRWLGEGGHFVDVLQYLTDANPVRVFAQAVTAEAAAGESIAASVSFSDGSVAAIVYADGADRAASRERLEVSGQGFACTIDDFRSVTMARGGRVKRVRRWEAARGYREELAAWVAAARGGTPPPVGAETYAANAACCFAILESARTGSPLTVDLATVLPDPSSSEQEGK